MHNFRILMRFRALCTVVSNLMRFNISCTNSPHPHITSTKPKPKPKPFSLTSIKAIYYKIRYIICTCITHNAYQDAHRLMRMRSNRPSTIYTKSHSTCTRSPPHQHIRISKQTAWNSF